MKREYYVLGIKNPENMGDEKDYQFVSVAVHPVRFTPLVEAAMKYNLEDAQQTKALLDKQLLVQQERTKEAALHGQRLGEYDVTIPPALFASYAENGLQVLKITVSSKVVE